MTAPDAGAPLIGLTAYATRAQWGVWDMDAVLLPDRYVAAVVGAGGAPVLLPPRAEVAAAVLPRLDGLLIAGGPDVDPARYGADRGPHTQASVPARDDAELALVAAARSTGVPLLGVCRGMQVLNVAYGGTLHQHLPDAVGSDVHAPTPGAFGSHPVRVEAGSLLARVHRSDAPLDVPTYHHQGVDRVGTGLTASAWAQDGLVEAVEDTGLPFVLGVQWHPEMGHDPSVFAGLVAAARQHRGRAAARGVA